MVRMPDGSAEPIGGGGIRYMDKKSFLNIAVPMDLSSTSSSETYTAKTTYSLTATISYTFTAKSSAITVADLSYISNLDKVYIRNMAAGYDLRPLENLSTTYYSVSMEHRIFTSYGFVATGTNNVGPFMSASTTEVVPGTGNWFHATFSAPEIEPNNVLFEINKQNKMLAIMPYNISYTGVLTSATYGKTYSNVHNNVINQMTQLLTSEGNNGCRLNILNLDIIEYM